MKINDLITEVKAKGYYSAAQKDKMSNIVKTMFKDPEDPDVIDAKRKIKNRDQGIERYSERGRKERDAQQAQAQQQQVEWDKENLPTLTRQLADLEKKFDPNFEYSDDHSVWSKNKELSGHINRLKHRIAQAQGGTDEGYHVYSRKNHDKNSSYNYNYTGHSFPDKESAMMMAQELDDSVDNVKFYKHVVRNSHPHQTGSHAGVSEAKSKKAKESATGGSTASSAVPAGRGKGRPDSIVV
jgi:hypothetical protein